MKWHRALLFLRLLATFAANRLYAHETAPDNAPVTNMPISGSSIVTLNATTVRLRWRAADPLLAGLLVQLHTLAETVTVSTSPTFPPDSSYSGTSAGLWVALSPFDIHVNVYARASGVTNASVSATGYTGEDPVPGACNLEFRMENDPNVHLRFSEFETVMEFAPANVGVARGEDPLSCDAGQGSRSRWQLTYEVYQYFLPEGDLSEGALFDGLKVVDSVEAVRRHGSKMSSLSSSSKTKLFGHAFPGLGVIHVVVVSDPSFNTSSLYVPAVTYSCNFSSVVPPTCHTQGEIFSLVFLTLLGTYGLFVCFTGHRFLEAEYFFFGFLISSFLCILLMGRYSAQSIQLCVLYSAVAGWWGGFLCALCRWRFGIPLLLTSLAGLVLGTLLAAVVMVTPVVNTEPLRNDLLYWVCVATGALVLPVLMLSCTRALNMAASAIVGSYVAVVALGLYLHAALPHVISSALLRRAVSPSYRQALLVLPFQILDGLLIVLWGALMVCGLLSQWRLTRDRPHFPQCPYQERRQHCGQPRPVDERSPLLFDGQDFGSQ
ncbi:transmembrane 7 superfamily member 3-like [Paramormyrops kingsleyae]|uniref:Transmembrane 7 superfamily member 3-like n=1 Tax=Paramormyrops kingsleyae TaxID=1676925 RepID=A0A3B3QR16_9TELE|nr:transmembrane 7 superfamily member 3-like [Paramormyrops kingsleyae]